jgi:hypothetical protein
MNERSIGEIILTGENKNTWGKSLSQCHFLHHKYRIVWIGVEPGPLRWVAGDITASGKSQPSNKLMFGQTSGQVLSHPLKPGMFISVLKEWSLQYVYAPRPALRATKPPVK